MNRRAIIIGVQTAAVALCVVIVYMTLLRPDSTAPLHGIQAPSPEGKPPPHAGGPLQPGGRHKPGESRAHGAAGTAGAGAAGAGTVGTVVPATTPTGDQYSDAVSQLMSRVRAADSANGPGSG